MAAHNVLYYREKDRMASEGWRYYAPVSASSFVMRRDTAPDEAEFALCTEDGCTQGIVAVVAVGTSCGAVCRAGGYSVDGPNDARGAALEARIADLEKTVKRMGATIYWLCGRHAVFRG